jgi:signal transduction histidine kinase
LYGERKDGSVFPAEVSLSYFNNSEGQLMVLAFVIDITERKKQEDEIVELNSRLEEKVENRTKELKNSYQLFSEIARNFPKGTINVFDKSLNYIFVEGQELYKLGVKSQQLVGSNYLTRLSPTIAKTIQPLLNEVFEGKSKTFEIETNGGYYQINAVPLPESNNEVERILVVEKNITEEKIAEEKIKKALEKEKELNELKSRFVTMASHEFRTPLSAIYSSATLLSKYQTKEQQDKRDKHIVRIKSTVNSLTQILNDVLSISKAEEGITKPEYKEVQVKDLCIEISEEIQSIARRGQRIIYEHTGASMILCDPDLMKKITLNLLSNALKYSYDKGKVYMSTQVLDSQLTIMITDYGIGIPIAEQNKLFNRFFRAANVANIEGTGLGLNIVKKYVELLSGTITFTSIPGEETIFTVKLPIK